MVSLNDQETLLLRETITDFGEQLTKAYNDKGLVKYFIKAKGFTVPSDETMDDEIYETLVALDWLRKDPQRIDEVATSLLFGLLSIIESAIPNDASFDDPEFEPSFTLLVKGMRVIEFKKPDILN